MEVHAQHPICHLHIFHVSQVSGMFSSYCFNLVHFVLFSIFVFNYSFADFFDNI